MRRKKTTARQFLMTRFILAVLRLVAALMLLSVIGYFLDGTIGSKTKFLSFGAFKPYLFAHPNPINVIISWIINWTISWQIIPYKTERWL